MTDGIEAITTTALGLALDAANLRQQTIAGNISNANTVDYVPLRVSFEAQLVDARRALESQGRLDLTSLAGVQPRIERAGLDSRGLPPKLLLDVEVAGMVQNSVRYQALVKGLSRHYATLSAAVSEGKR